MKILFVTESCPQKKSLPLIKSWGRFSSPSPPVGRPSHFMKNKFQITRFLRFASQITRPTIFSCLARFPSNQFTQSPTIHVSAYPVAKISHVSLPGRPNFSSRLPGNDIFLLSSNFVEKLTNQFTQSPTIRVSAYPVANHFSCQITRSAKFLVQITRRLTYFSLQLTRADTDGCLV